MKDQLLQTINVKMKYEKIIDRLLSEPETKSKTIKIIKDCDQLKDTNSHRTEPNTQSERVIQHVNKLNSEVATHTIQVSHSQNHLKEIIMTEDNHSSS